MPDTRNAVARELFSLMMRKGPNQDVSYLEQLIQRCLLDPMLCKELLNRLAPSLSAEVTNNILALGGGALEGRLAELRQQREGDTALPALPARVTPGISRTDKGTQ